MEPKSYHILHLGAGVQSSALYLMFLNGEFDGKLDYAVFADAHEEPKGIYKHLEWLWSLGGPPILTDTALVASIGLLIGCLPALADYYSPERMSTRGRSS